MKRFQILAGLVLGAALLSPIALTADDHHDRRYYDRDGRDYHVYNGQEERAYRVYLGEQRREYREFHRMRRVERRHYFRWRHEHPDHVLFKLDIR